MTNHATGSEEIQLRSESGQQTQDTRPTRAGALSASTKRRWAAANKTDDALTNESLEVLEDDEGRQSRAPCPVIEVRSAIAEA